MRRKMPGLLLLTCLSPMLAQVNPAERLKAQRELDDQKWAQKTGLAVSDVQALRIAAGIADGSNFSRIQNIDGFL
jgi:hypothetical protein